MGFKQKILKLQSIYIVISEGFSKASTKPKQERLASNQLVQYVSRKYSNGCSCSSSIVIVGRNLASILWLRRPAEQLVKFLLLALTFLVQVRPLAMGGDADSVAAVRPEVVCSSVILSQC